MGHGTAQLRSRQNLDAEVIHERQPGFGAACHAGLLAARSDIVCFMDCDASLDPRQLPRVVDPVRDGGADLVLGRRRPSAGAWPLHARLMNRALAWQLRRLLGVQLSDLGPMRAARRRQLLALGISDRRFAWPVEMVVLAVRRGLTIAETDVSYLPRLGRSKVTGTPVGTSKASFDISRMAYRAARCPPDKP